MICRVLIPLWRRGKVVAYARIDAADVTTTARFRWRLLTTHGHSRAVRGRNTYLSRELLGLKPGDRRQADHRNGDALDNRRSNLRVATHGQNQQNRTAPRRGSASGVRGVSWDTARQKWSAQAQVDGRFTNLGRFNSIEEAEAVVVAFRRKHSEMDR